MKSRLRTRREALKMIGIAAGAGAATAALQRAGASMSTDTAPRAYYFGLADVRLGAGPFLDAQRRDSRYLLQLESDRMLHNFRVNAGLTPKAPVYGGWESQEPWVEIRCHGHTLGHYLTACACMFESTGDSRFAKRVDYIVAELAECQAKTGGWLTAFPDGVTPLTDSLAGKPFAGVPWYTTHKIMAGLRDAHVHRGSKPALDVLVRFADWIDTASRDVPTERFQKMLDREHGGMNEVCADLFALTSEQRYLDLAIRFSHQALLEPLSLRRDTLDGLHANTQIPKVIGFNRLFELHGDPDYGNAAEFFWHTVAEQRSFATGGHGDVEHFFPKGEFAPHLDSAKTMETCCTHNMLRLTRALFERVAHAHYADYFERALFNGILASQDPDSGMMTYFQSTRPGYVKLYHTPFDSFWCCTGSGMENHARYGESIYTHDGDALYVNLFISSTVEWRERGMHFTQSTKFPDSDVTRLRFAGKRARDLTLAIRHPGWCKQMTLRINGGEEAISWKPGDYFRIKRDFREGDVVEVRMPMELRLEPLPNAPNYAALMYGPIVLAARLGTQGLSKGSQLIVNERESGNMLNEAVPIPRWSRPLNELVTNTKRTDPANLRFTTSGFDGGATIELIPWFRIAHERYNLYWQRSQPVVA